MNEKKNEMGARGRVALVAPMLAIWGWMVLGTFYGDYQTCGMRPPVGMQALAWGLTLAGGAAIFAALYRLREDGWRRWNYVWTGVGACLGALASILAPMCMS